MYTFVVQLYKDSVGLIDPPLVVVIARLPSVKYENHASVEGLLTHCPTYEYGFLAMVEEHKGSQDADTRIDYQGSATLWCAGRNLFGRRRTA
jgi:hypothetical protein